MTGAGHGSAAARVRAALDAHGCCGGPKMYQCPAPGHDDQQASLSVDQGSEGAVINCFAGCSTLDDVLPAIGLAGADLFDEPLDRGGLPPVRVVAEYRYTDSRGELLFVKERREGPGVGPGKKPKYMIRRPDGRGGWAWKIGDAERVLYRLPEVLAAISDGRQVILAEGEKDCDRLASMGLTATTSFDGASKDARPKWKPAYGDMLAGAQVLIIGDNDEAGIAHARAAAADLRGKARSVAVRLPAVTEEHADVSDHLNAGHSLEELRALPGEPDWPQGDGWEDLVPLGTRALLPPFPSAVFPGWLADMVTAAAEEIQVPADLTGALALGVLSTAAAGRAEVAVRGQWREPVNLFLSVAMPPGSGKSPAFRLMNGPVFAAEKEMAEAAREQMTDAVLARELAIEQAQDLRHKAKTEEAKSAAIAAVQAAEALPVPVIPRLTADDVSPEQAASIMAEQDGRLAILSAEGTYFAIICGRYSSGTPNVELTLKGHAGDRVQVDRRGRAELIERPAMTIATTVQPTVLKELAGKPAIRERGVLARFLLSLPADVVGSRNITPQLVPDSVLREYSDAIRKLIIDLSAWSDPAVIMLTPAALKRHTEWRAEIEPRLKLGTGDLEALRDWAGKLAGATARLAGLLHLAWHPATGVRTGVSEETMERAIVLARYWAEHAMNCFGAMKAHPALDDARAVLERILDRPDPGATVTRREIHIRMQRRFPRAADLSAPLAVLQEHGYLRLQEAPRGPGRPSERFSVHPKAVTK